MRLIAAAAFAPLLFAAEAPAQDTLLTRLLIANRHAVRITDGRLSESGGRLLVEEGRRARFFLVGEEHGVAETPTLVQALLDELRPAGYNTFAIEVSPLQGERVSALGGHARAHDELDTLLSSWFTTLPFYVLAEERALLESTLHAQGGRPASPPMHVWGLDYDISADRLFLRELERLAPPSGRAAVGRARALADSGFAVVFTQHNPSRLFAWSAPDSIFTALREAFGANLPPRAREIIDVFERTARINRLFMSGRGYESNLMRAAFMRENFAKALAAGTRRGTPPRVLFKFGGAHMMRGLTYTHTLDLGTAATIVAESRGERSFNILVLGGPGSKSARMNIMSGQYEPTGSAEVGEENTAWLLPALAERGWSLFDMRAVRLGYLRRGPQSLTPIQDRFLQAYDAIVVLNGSTPGTPRPLALR